MKYIEPKLKNKIESMAPFLPGWLYRSLMATAEEDPTVARHLIESIEREQKPADSTDPQEGRE